MYRKTNRILKIRLHLYSCWNSGKNAFDKVQLTACKIKRLSRILAFFKKFLNYVLYENSY